MTPTFQVLLIDDDAAMRTALSDLFEAAGWRVDTAQTGKEGLSKMLSAPPDVIVSDVRMPSMTGLEMLSKVDLKTAPPVILISAHGDIPTAVEAIQKGAYTFLEKPYDPRRLLSASTHAAEQNRLKHTTDRLKKRLSTLSGLDQRLIGRSDKMANVRDDIVDFADLTVPVLVMGETGTGKELAARALHDLSTRSDSAFNAVSCATLDAEQFDRLFSTQTSADAAQTQGTLFLDDVSSCPLDTQAKLLRLIESMDHSGDQTLRIVAATNQDLDDMIRNGQFREDLYFRLNGLTLSLPALRDNRDDIALLFTHFTDDYAQAHGVILPTLSPDDLKRLVGHEWPGNVRELRSVALRYVLSARRADPSVSASLSAATTGPDTPTTLREAVASFEREMIARALEQSTGTMDDVANELGIGRRTLNEKIVKLGLDR